MTPGKILYGALFAVVLPALLVLWAHATRDVVGLPPIHSLPAGIALAALGFAVLVSGWRAPRVHGDGSPMNGFPPPRYATRGIYALLPYPIHVGFSGIVLGASIATGSASGLWLVWPAVALASVALVYGYERHELLHRFGSLARPWLSLPQPGDEVPGWGDRAFVWLCVGLPWVAIYEAIATITPPDPIHTSFAFEKTWPVLGWSEAAYASVYLVALAAPLLVRTRTALRTLAVRMLLAMALVFPLYLALPCVAQPRLFVSHTALGWLLVHERAFETPSCALPSFQVIFALLLGEAIASHPRLRAARLAWLWAIAAIASCLTTGMDTLVDIAAGVGVWVLVRHAGAVWEGLRRSAERLANSWLEKRFGPVRVINHGVYAALGTAVALAIVGSFAEVRPLASVSLVWVCTLVGAAAWAQWIEGASGLSRPFGFWGGLLGAIAGGLFTAWLGASQWVILGGLCVAAPFIQSLGRLRCLVQGCCHGSLAPAAVGIAHHHPRSRVAKIPELVDKPLYPTALFSILCNGVVALVVVRLAWLHAPSALVGGTYLIVSGLGRFVEESYRGEPQTPITAGLRLYQWVSIAAIVAGALVTALARGPAMPTPVLDPRVIALALGLGALNMLAFGVDFPESTRRFSRLA